MVERLTIEQETEHLEDVMGECADVIQHHDLAAMHLLRRCR